MATFYAAFCIIQTLFGIGSRKDQSRNATDWLKLALAVAAQPEDEESKRLIQDALESNNQEFLDFLRAALNTRVAAAARLADIESDGIECRAFLPGSPALWGWTTNMAAESAILKAGIEAAIHTSVFDSPSPSCSNTSEDVFVSLNSSETMGGATLRDIYAKAWEFHREPLIWTPRGPGAGVGASTWTLTPASLTSQGARNRNRSVSDASESRSSIIGQSPCLQAHRNRARRDSLHDVFAPLDTKNIKSTSPCVETGVVTSSPSVTTPPPPSACSEPPASQRPRRSTSCARSHISSTTAITVSECSTTQELTGLGLGRSLDRSVWSRSDTPSESCFSDELGNEVDVKGRRPLSSQGRGPSSHVVAFRRSKVSGHSTFASKQAKLSRPNVAPSQSSQSSVPKRSSDLSQSSGAPTKNQREAGGRTSRFNSVVATTQAARIQELSLRRVHSVATMTPSPSPHGSRAANTKARVVGPVASTRRVWTKQDVSPTESSEPVQNMPPRVLNSTSASAAPRHVATAPRVLGPSSRPASRAGSVSGLARSGSPLPTTSRTPKREPQQLPTPTSTPRTREPANSQPLRPIPAGTVNLPRSRAGSSTQERPVFAKDTRLSRPSSRAHLKAGPSEMLKQRSRRSDSITSVSTMVDRWEPAVDKSTMVAA